jgi:hypothetical protein
VSAHMRAFRGAATLPPSSTSRDAFLRALVTKYCWIAIKGRVDRTAAFGSGRVPAHPELLPHWGMCYNRPAVERTVKPGVAPGQPEPAVVPLGGATAVAPRAASAREQSAVPQEDASRYCPLCSQRLESRRCKLICPVCGYYMSCADYY